MGRHPALMINGQPPPPLQETETPHEKKQATSPPPQGSDMGGIRRYSPWTELHTRAKTLPFPKIPLRALIKMNFMMTIQSHLVQVRITFLGALIL